MLRFKVTSTQTYEFNLSDGFINSFPDYEFYINEVISQRGIMPRDSSVEIVKVENE